jgi:hypothetical protein
MATTIGRIITGASAAPELFALGDKAGPQVRELAALGVRAAELMKDPAMAALAKRVQQLVIDLDLGGDIPAAEVVTPKEAIKQIAKGNITPDQKAQLDFAGQSGGL